MQREGNSGEQAIWCLSGDDEKVDRGGIPIESVEQRPHSREGQVGTMLTRSDNSALVDTHHRRQLLDVVTILAGADIDVRARGLRYRGSDSPYGHFIDKRIRH